MNKPLPGFMASTEMVALSWLGWQLCQLSALANPAGGTVTHGTASFNSSGSQLTVNVATPTATINWQSFNIGTGETTTFVQPSSSSVVWNQINGASPSQILGSLNANGYVILQNTAGFYIGGQAAITAHGLLMTTSPTPPPDLTSGGAWSFNAPPPTAKIINYGQINIGGGGSAFLIAGDIVNNGTISAPSGKIGLYDGEQVLVSLSPDGRGLSAQVTLPQGSVDNEGKLIADGGTIAAQAQTVNQNGLAQANSVQNINGVVELVASDSLTLGANSDIEANGDNTAANPSPGGFVVLQSGNTFSDTTGSQINAAGSPATGGQTGVVEFFGNNLTDAASIQSLIDGGSAAQFGSSGALQGALLVNPNDLTISANPSGILSTGPNEINVNVADLAAYGQIDLHALDNIELQTGWSLNDPGAPATLSLSAGNNITLDDNSSINGGNNWNVDLTAGTGFVPTTAQSAPAAGSDGIYLNCNAENSIGNAASIRTQNGDINLWAANEVQIAPGGSDSASSSDEAGFSGITTRNGGNINVTTLYGDVNTGDNPNGYDYEATAPYFTVDPGLGGISTAAGGNVTINAGDNVYSYLPSGTDIMDGGSGAFGPEAGNLTITAGGSVYGHYVVANGAGLITAGQNAGSDANNIALSLVAGNWTVDAPNGNIYLQEVRNPNGTFNDAPGSRRSPNLGAFLFDYAVDASVDLNAGLGVYLTDEGVPRLDTADVPVLYPPTLDISAGSGGVTLEGNVTLFPSADQNLNITTTDGGSLVALPNLGSSPFELLMSDSASTSWQNALSFLDTDNSTGTPEELNNPNPVVINVAGNMENLDLITSKATQINVGGDMINCGFSGQNLHASDVTSITVGGQIFNQSAYVFVTLPQGIPNLPAADLPPGYASSWSTIFTLAVTPALAGQPVPANLTPSQLATYALEQGFFGYSIQAGQYVGNNPGFIYNAGTGQLGYAGPMSATVLSALAQPTVTVIRYGANGLPETYTGANGQTYFVTDQVSWAPPAVIQSLYSSSQSSSSYENPQLGYRIGGPGEFDVTAGSISLGNSYGLLSCGVEDPQGGFDRYANLAVETSSGASLNVTVSGDLDMLSSTIATLGGGDVNLTSTDGSMDLGSAALVNTAFSIPRQIGLGVYTAGLGDVNVTAFSDVDIDGSRIAAFDGGNIFVESLQGDINIGSGLSTPNGVYVSYVDPQTADAAYYAEDAYGSGLVAYTLQDPSQVPDSPLIPGNITVKSPYGNITASVGGITQIALNGNVSAGPTIDLDAGTPQVGMLGSANYVPEFIGNIDLGDGVTIGGAPTFTATGKITVGIVLSRAQFKFSAGQSFTGTVVSQGGISGNAGGAITGTLVGVGGVNVSGVSVTATVLSQNASVNGAAGKSTLGSSANATSASQSAANQSDAQARQTLAANDAAPAEDLKKKKPLIQRIKRVTVILPAKT
jgi:filamentous hemagglutinin family protein